jgi:hypothetical protein
MTTKRQYSAAHLLPAETLLYGPNRKYPPYGKRVAGILDNPALPHRYSGCKANRASIWVTTDWDWPDYHPNHLSIVMPVTEDPGDYQWHFLQGHEPILLNNISAPFAEQIATAMIRDGVLTVLTVNNESTIYRKQQHDH